MKWVKWMKAFIGGLAAGLFGRDISGGPKDDAVLGPAESFSGDMARMSLWKLALGSGEETPVVEALLLMSCDFAVVDEGVYFGSEVAEAPLMLVEHFR